MAATDIFQTLIPLLWERPGEQVYAAIDGASCKGLLDQLYGPTPPEFACLYRGELDPDLVEAAPYLARLDRGTPFAEWLIRRGFGQHWNIFINSTADLRIMRRHLRSLNIVYSQGKPLLFRYYDPRVLNLVLPTFTIDQLREFFGPVTRYLAEGKEQNQIRSFALAENGSLVESVRSLGGAGGPA